MHPGLYRDPLSYGSIFSFANELMDITDAEVAKVDALYDTLFGNGENEFTALWEDFINLTEHTDKSLIEDAFSALVKHIGGLVSSGCPMQEREKYAIGGVLVDPHCCYQGTSDRHMKNINNIILPVRRQCPGDRMNSLGMSIYRR
jgi:hypothetical protein